MTKQEYNKNKKPKPNRNELILAANFLADSGYDVIAIKHDEQLPYALNITVSPPEKDIHK